jgi:hypothetical protein
VEEPFLKNSLSAVRTLKTKVACKPQANLHQFATSSDFLFSAIARDLNFIFERGAFS